MTGKPFCKTRTITSERLISPLAGKRDLNDAAISFKSAVHESISRPTLNVGLSIKALESASGNETYKDTDGKKRTNSGGTPGMVELPNGYRYDPNQKWEDGKVLKLFPSIKSRKSAIKEPNFGWVDKQSSLTADEYAKELAKKPQLRIRKYKVNKKTDEIIPESEQLLDPFSLSGGAKSESNDYQVKRLPGRTIGQRGRSLVARAASAFGIIVDENGKFRCPPGTPAANQFTDSSGTNCFGVSASEILDFAKKLASGMDVDSDAYVKNSTKKLFQFVSWLDNGGIPGLGRTVWRDQDGNKIRNIKKWREVRKTESGRVFVDGMIRAQDKLAQQDMGIASLMDMLGVVRTDEKRKTNDDVFEVFDKLRESGAWTVDTSTRLSAEDVDTIVKARLAHVPGFSNLSPERQKKLIEADTERWYTTERALLEASLDSFIADPEHMRTISKINFQVKNPNGKGMDEASMEGHTTPDSNRLMSIINVDIPEIMNNQEAHIPSLAPNERMKIDFTGGRTDSESAKELTDFLVTVDGHSKQLAAMVEERAYARHIMKHEIAHTIQFQAFAREAERQIRTNGFINVMNSKGEMVRVDDVKSLNSGMVFSLMKEATDGIDLESLKNALSRADVVGFLAGDYPKMYFNDEDGAEVWALEATAELWALRDLGLIYGDDIDSALEWMDDVSDGRYLDIRRRSDAEGLRDIEARFYENRGPDPELSGNSIAEVKERLEKEHKERLSQIEKWSNDESTTSDDFIGSLAELEYRREALNAAYDNLEASGESKDSPQFKKINRSIKETNAYISLIEKKWAERFSSSDSDKRKKDVKSMRESVRQTMFAEGLLQPEEMAARVRQQDIKNLKETADSMTADEVIQKLADIEISLKEPGISEGMKSELLEDKKIVRAIYKSRFGSPEDAKEWSKKRRELDTKIDEIVNPPRQQALKKTKKVKTDKSGASYAKKIQKDESYAMTLEQATAVERLGDPAMTDIGNLVDPDGNVSAVKNINRRYRRAQRSAGDLSPGSETAALEDQIEKVLIPAMEAMDESSVPDDLEIEAEMYFGVTNSGFKDVHEYFDNQCFVTGRIITDESPHKPGEARDANGEVVTRAGKEKTRVIVQVSKGDKGLFRTNETILGDEGALVLPPGKMKVVDVRPDGTIVLRVQEQDNVVDVLNRVSSSIGEEGPGASQHAKGTKKKIDRVANKYVAQRKENGLSSTPSRPKRDVEIEDKNVAVKREVIKAGGSFGEPPSEDYIAEIGKVPLVQPEEADIKPDPVDPRTGRPQMKVVSRMNVEELVNRRAAVYRNLLDLDYANDRKGFQGTDRATLKSLDDELVKRGEITTNLPQPPDFDPDHKPGSKKKAPYKTSVGSAPDPTSGREVLGIPQTREQRKAERTTRANMTFEDVKRILAGESPKEVMNDMSRDSLDPAVADEIARKSPEALIKDIEDAALEFHAGVDKRPRVRMTESQLTKFANDGELLPTETDDIVLESGAIGRRLERRLNPATRRSSPGFSSGKRSDSARALPTAESSLAKLKESSEKAQSRVDGLEKAIDVLKRTGNWRGEEFGVIISNHPDWKGDTGKFDADTPPVNITKEEIENRFGSVEFLLDLAEEKLDRSKKEIVLAEHLAKSKEIRTQQNTLDIEDLSPEDFQILLDEYKQLTPEDYGGAVIHVGQAELDGGVLDPSRTVGGKDIGAVGGAGNTGALNENQISNLKIKNEELKGKLTFAESILKSFNDGEETYTPKNAMEAEYLNRLFGAKTGSLGEVSFEEGVAYDLNRMTRTAALSKINSELDLIKPQIKTNDETLGAIQGVGRFGFVSAYPASAGVTTDGYFGRNAGSVIPKDIATYRTELDAKRSRRPQYDDIQDGDTFVRWLSSLRGSAYLVTDPSVISDDLGPRSMGEKQILGKVKPVFSVSAPKRGYNPLTSDDTKQKEWGDVASALMARAIRLEKEGIEVTPASVLGVRRGKPLSDFDSSSGKLSSGKRGEIGTTRRVAGVAGSRATGRVLEAVLKRSGADEDTRERVKYGMNMAGALAAGGPAGFATALAVDVSRRAGREIAERGLEEAVQRGKITQQQMDVAMQAVNRVAPNGLPDPVVDKLADAWSVASDFIGERVATGENMQRLDEFGDVIRTSGGEFVTNIGEVAGSAREKIGKKFKKIKKGKNNRDNTSGEPDLADLRARFGSEPTPSSNEYDDPFAGFDENNYTPAKTEFDDFGDAFSSGKRAGRSADSFRGEYNSRIGISKNTPNSSKPVSGYVVHRSHNEEKKRQIAALGKGNIGSDAIFEVGDNDVVGDGLTALGEIEVVLKPEVSDRTSYGRGEALQSAHRPVSMNSSDPDDIADALFNADGISSKEQNAESMLHLLGAKMDKNFSSVGASRDENGKMSPVGMVDSGTRAHEPFEAQILGGFKKNEVEGIHYPYSKVSKIAESEDISDVVSQNSMKSKLEKLGFTPEEIAYFYSMSGGKPINTSSMTKLKEYRAAKKIKEQYEGMGIGYVKFAHPQGINIENPRSYDKTANQNARVDEILKKAIDAEIDAELKKTLDSIRKGQQLDLVVD